MNSSTSGWLVLTRNFVAGSHPQNDRLAIAQLCVGSSYERGMGVDKDAVEAVRWYRKAAEQGDAEAQHNLGVCFGNGTGIGKDLTEAARWYRKAAEQGLATAQPRRLLP